MNASKGLRLQSSQSRHPLFSRVRRVSAVKPHLRCKMIDAASGRWGRCSNVLWASLMSCKTGSPLPPGLQSKPHVCRHVRASHRALREPSSQQIHQNISRHDSSEKSPRRGKLHGLPCNWGTGLFLSGPGSWPGPGGPVARSRWPGPVAQSLFEAVARWPDPGQGPPPMVWFWWPCGWSRSRSRLALVTVCSRNTNVIMVWAWMLS